MEVYVHIGVGVLIGLYVMFSHIKLNLLDKKIDLVESKIPDATDVAKEILNIKLPVEDLPKETVDMIKKEEDDKKKKEDNTYFG